MRGPDEQTQHMFSYLSPEQRVPADHPLRAIRALTDEALRSMSVQWERLYATTGRPSIPPEQLLRALLLQVLYTVRSERLLMEELDYNLLPPAQRAGGPVAGRPGNPTVNFHGERRRNDTHQSTTDPQARLYRKDPGREATLAYLGHVLLDNRHGLVANVCVTAATGTAERDAASWMLAASAPPGSTVGGDKGYDVARFVDDVRALEVTPHIARKVRYSAIDGRTTRHPGYEVSQRKRKLVEQVFGWMKTVGGLRKLRHRGGALVDWNVTFAAAAYNLVRLRTLVATGA